MLQTGYYGKAPSAGDFIGRGLPRALTRRWDRWMELGLREAMQAGGGGAWRFVAGEGVFGPEAVSGVFQLSQDRVGRRFPFLVAVTGGLVGAADPWFDAAEALVTEARGGGLGPEDLAARCAAMPPPLGPGPVPGGGVAVFWLGAEPRSPHAFASLEALAAGGLAALFAAGGPAEPIGAAETFDPDDSARLAAEAGYAPDAVPAVPLPDEPVDLDDLFAEVGLGEGAPAAPADEPGAGPAPETSAGLPSEALPPASGPAAAPDEPAEAPSGPLPGDAMDLDDLLADVGLAEGAPAAPADPPGAGPAPETSAGLPAEALPPVAGPAVAPDEPADPPAGPLPGDPVDLDDLLADVGLAEGVPAAPADPPGAGPAAETSAGQPAEALPPAAGPAASPDDPEEPPPAAAPLPSLDELLPPERPLPESGTAPLPSAALGPAEEVAPPGAVILPDDAGAPLPPLPDDGDAILPPAPAEEEPRIDLDRLFDLGPEIEADPDPETDPETAPETGQGAGRGAGDRGSGRQ